MSQLIKSDRVCHQSDKSRVRACQEDLLSGAETIENIMASVACAVCQKPIPQSSSSSNSSSSSSSSSSSVEVECSLCHRKIHPSCSSRLSASSEVFKCQGERGSCNDQVLAWSKKQIEKFEVSPSVLFNIGLKIEPTAWNSAVLDFLNMASHKHDLFMVEANYKNFLLLAKAVRFLQFTFLFCACLFFKKNDCK
jgi:hypothetical protein